MKTHTQLLLSGLVALSMIAPSVVANTKTTPSQSAAVARFQNWEDQLGTLYQKQEFAKAEAFLLQAVRELEKESSQESTRILSGVYFALIDMYSKQKKFHIFQETIQKAMRFVKERIGAESLDMAELRVEYGSYCLEVEDYAKAKEYFTAALKALEASPKANYKRKIGVCAILAEVCMQLKDYEAGNMYLQKGIALCEKHGDLDSIQQLYSYIANSYMANQDFQRGIAAYIAAFEDSKRRNGLKNPKTIEALKHLTNACFDARDIKNLLKYSKLGIDTAKEFYGIDSDETQALRGAFGIYLIGAGCYAEAEEFYLQFADVMRKDIKKNPNTNKAETYILFFTNIQDLYKEQKQYKKALPYAMEKIAFCESATGKKHPETIAAYLEYFDIISAIQSKEHQAYTAEIIRKLTALKGNAYAQYALAFAYSGGLVTGQPDEKKATELLILSAEQGYVTAQYLLGMSYEAGRGIQKSDSDAVKWLRKAAEQNYPAAQFNLGEMYENGRGVQQSRSEAEAWYRKAIQNGYDPAKGFSINKGKQ